MSASGIFVIACTCAIIYKEVWNAGGRRQFALALQQHCLAHLV